MEEYLTETSFSITMVKVHKKNFFLNNVNAGGVNARFGVYFFSLFFLSLSALQLYFKTEY